MAGSARTPIAPRRIHTGQPLALMAFRARAQKASAGTFILSHGTTQKSLGLTVVTGRRVLEAIAVSNIRRVESSAWRAATAVTPTVQPQRIRNAVRLAEMASYALGLIVATCIRKNGTATSVPWGRFAFTVIVTRSTLLGPRFAVMG